ncbi:exodeoxyribonuclease VII large subunit [Uliginosibacterium paludis]|uniref:Exodeoxyribonuclease 7 large subunit n=1 Tax=Uliginosibacterium paludis TaxID=1615952 RepID=A0ABV2CRH7_9RHOO
MNNARNNQEQAGARVSSVSEFVLQIRTLVERNVPLGWIGGEISNLVQAGSGHLYFTLRDDRAQIRCAMWRNRAQLLGFRLAEGMRVEVRAQATIYEARGDLQLSVESIRRAGLGNLFEAYLRLKARLEAEGLFEAARKGDLPRLPRGIALVTSASGAVLHDVVTVLQRRAPALPVTIYPCLVQGEAAPAQIAGAIAAACSRAGRDGNDVLLVCRGGGSLEDLWAFNDEVVVRAIAASSLPVISGIGHETDTTLADFVADLRAPTPSAAAEIASSGWFELRQSMPAFGRSLRKLMEFRLQRAFQRLDELQLRLKHPRTRLLRGQERISGAERELRQLMRAKLRERTLKLAGLEVRLRNAAPRPNVQRKRLDAAATALRRVLDDRLANASQHLAHLAARLEGLNPDAVLARGYAIVRDESGRILRDAGQSQSGQILDVQLARGRIRTRVERP